MKLKENTIVQIVPEHRWAGCLVVVTELKPWGIQGFVQIPMQGQAYIRLEHKEYEVVGQAAFVIAE
jgi:hypothetical protein